MWYPLELQGLIREGIVGESGELGLRRIGAEWREFERR